MPADERWHTAVMKRKEVSMKEKNILLSRKVKERGGRGLTLLLPGIDHKQPVFVMTLDLVKAGGSQGFQLDFERA